LVNEYIMYCDESEAKGRYYSNFYGGALVRSKDLKLATSFLKQKKSELNLYGEIKWSKVTSIYCGKYIKLMNSFFDLIEKDMIKVRMMFTQNIYEASNLTPYHREHEYFLLYYQFVKNSFGWRYSNETSQPIGLRIYFDKLPNTREKAEQFKSFIRGLSKNPEFIKSRIFIRDDAIAEVTSHDHVILQCLDVVLGAIHFRLNDKHKEISIETGIRAKRTIAKEALYKHINKRICFMHPNFNIGLTTGRNDNLKNAWCHSYRHRLFVPKDKKIDLGKAKNKGKKKQKNPASAMSFDVAHVERETSQ